MRGLPALFPGMMSSRLFSPPFRAESRLSRRKWLFGRSGPWQRKQLASKMGLMSRWKSIVMFAGGGSLEVSIAAAEALQQASKIAASAIGRPTQVLFHSLNDVRCTTESTGNQYREAFGVREACFRFAT